MENYLWIGFIGAVLALLFAAIQRKKVMSYSEGNATMQKIAQSIREGANAYLKHQYSTVAKVFAVVFVVLVIIAFASGGEMLSKFTPFAFLTGGIWSMLAGLIGMKIATNSNARTAQDQEEAGEEDKDGVQGLLIHRLAVQLDHLHRPGMGEPAEGAAGAAEQQQHPGGFETAGGAAGASAQEHQQHQDKLGDGGPEGEVRRGKACGGDH